MVDQAAFWDKTAAKYAATPIGDPQAYAHTLARTRHHLDANARVLEIGCGTGSTATELAPDVAQITGTDVSPKMIAIAQGKGEAHDNATFRVQSADQALADAGDVDAILAFNILHLVPDLPDLLARVHQRLGPQGLFISKTPCIAEPAIGFKRFAIRALVPVAQWIGKAPPVGYLTFAALEAQITAAGFTVEETCSKPAMTRYIVARKA